MKTEVLTYVALSISCLGIIVSIINAIRNIKAQRKFIELLKTEKHKLNLEKLKFNENIQKLKINMQEFENIKTDFKNITFEMEDNDRYEILESLNQKSTKGQINYVNKMLHLSGSTESIIVK
jgi:bifunctional ADP-heptose synthase (sugar kinase/adenylyltransferase)